MKRNESSSEIIKEITKESEGITYRYILRASTSKRVASFHIPLYSIEVQMNKDGTITSNSIEDVFSDIGKASVFFGRLVDNLATPIDLTYILEDKITL